MDEPSDRQILEYLERHRALDVLLELGRAGQNAESDEALDAVLASSVVALRAVEMVWWKLDRTDDEPEHPAILLGEAGFAEQLARLSARLDAAQGRCVDELRARVSVPPDDGASVAPAPGEPDPLGCLFERWRKEDEEEEQRAFRQACDDILHPSWPTHWPDHIRKRYPDWVAFRPWVVARALLHLDGPMAALRLLAEARTAIVALFREVRHTKPTSRRRPSAKELRQKLGPEVGELADAAWEALPALEYILRCGDTNEPDDRSPRGAGNVLGRLATEEGVAYRQALAEGIARQANTSVPAVDEQELCAEIFEHLINPGVLLGTSPRSSSAPLRYLGAIARSKSVDAVNRIMSERHGISRHQFRRSLKRVRAECPGLSDVEVRAKAKAELAASVPERRKLHRDPTGATLTIGELHAELGLRGFDVPKPRIGRAVDRMAKAHGVPAPRDGGRGPYRVPKAWKDALFDLLLQRTPRAKADDETEDEEKRLGVEEAASELRCDATMLGELAADACARSPGLGQPASLRLTRRQWEDLRIADALPEVGWVLPGPDDPLASITVARVSGDVLPPPHAAEEVHPVSRTKSSSQCQQGLPCEPRPNSGNPSRPRAERNWALAIALQRDGRPQFQIARDAGLRNETRLSRIKTGRDEATLEEKRGIATALGMSVDDLFPSPEGHCDDVSTGSRGARLSSARKARGGAR